MRSCGIVCAISLVALSIFNQNQFASAQLTFDPNNKFASIFGDNADVKTTNNIKTYQISNPAVSKSTCTDLPVASVTSSGGTNGNSAFRAVDKDEGTKWSSKGSGSYLQADLGSSKAVCSVGIAWDKSNHKTYDFVLSASNDTSNFKDILKGSSTRSSDYQSYDLGKIHAQYIKVTLVSNGNGHDKSASIKELSVKGGDAPVIVPSAAASVKGDALVNVPSAAAASRCYKLGITELRASSSDGANTPNNSIDNNLSTRWSSSDNAAYIQADVGSVKRICGASIAWFKGDSRQYLFAIATSRDGTNYQSVFRGISSGDRTQPEIYRFHNTDARYVKIMVTHNTGNDGIGINELAVYGTARQNSPPPQPPGNPPPSKNHAPLVKDITGLTTPQDTSRQISITVYDPDTKDNATIQVVRQPNHGTVDAGLTQNSFRYIPANGYHGLDNFTYQATDNHGAKSNIATVGILVELVNHPPKAEEITGIITSEDKPVQITAKVTDPDIGDTVRVVPVTQPTHGSVTVNSTSSIFTYSPNKGYFGDDNFTYQGIDDHGVKSNAAVISIRVNAPPAVKDLTVFSVQDTSIAIPLTGTDPDTARGDTVSLAVVDKPTHGNVTLDAVSKKYVYTPASNYTGDDAFTYQATDNHGAKSNIGTVSITVLPANRPIPPPPSNHAPTVQNTNITTKQDTAVTIPITVSDPDQGDTATITNTNSPSHGTIALGSDKTSFVYTPTTGFSGSDSFTVQATDSHGAKSNVATISITVTPSTTGGGGGGTGQGVDKFGIKEIYPTKPGGEEWFMNMQDPNHDKRTSPPSMTQNSDGSWKVTSGKVRYGVFTSTGYHPDQIKYKTDQKAMEKQGYMQSPNDWKNIEMTGQVKFVSGDSGDSWTWYARGGTHTGSGNPAGCEGTAYKADLFYGSGQVRYAKEQWHVHYLFTGSKPSPAISNGKFVGFKAAMYNIIQNGQTAVKLEIWVDPNNNNSWQKVYEHVDSGGWGDDGQECGGATDQLITWGGPIATFRWDNANNVSIKNLSVREIQPPQ